MKTGVTFGFLILAIPVIGVTPSRLGMKNWPGWWNVYCNAMIHIGKSHTWRFS